MGAIRINTIVTTASLLKTCIDSPAQCQRVFNGVFGALTLGGVAQTLHNGTTRFVSNANVDDGPIVTPEDQNIEIDDTIELIPPEVADAASGAFVRGPQREHEYFRVKGQLPGRRMEAQDWRNSVMSASEQEEVLPDERSASRFVSTHHYPDGTDEQTVGLYVESRMDVAVYWDPRKDSASQIDELVKHFEDEAGRPVRAFVVPIREIYIDGTKTEFKDYDGNDQLVQIYVRTSARFRAEIRNLGQDLAEKAIVSAIVQAAYSAEVSRAFARYNFSRVEFNVATIAQLPHSLFPSFRFSNPNLSARPQ